MTYKSVPQYLIYIISVAGSHSQGLRRLSKSYYFSYVESSSQFESAHENERKKSKKNNSYEPTEILLNLAGDAVKQSLQRIPPFPFV